MLLLADFRLSRKLVLIISLLIMAVVLTSIVIIATAGIVTTSKRSQKKGILMIGGGSSPESQCSLEFYSPSANTSRFLSLKLLSCRNHHSSVRLSDGRILVVGGEMSNRHLTKNTELIDLTTQSVTNGPRMLQSRKTPGAAVYKDKVFVCGGYNYLHGDMGTCEMLIDNKWERMKPMQIGRHAPALVAVKGSLFAIGGRQSGQFTKSVEKYSISSNDWHRMSAMNQGRDGAGASLLNDDVIVCGGFYHGEFLNQCEKYVVVRNRWLVFPYMNSGRAIFAMCNVDGALYVLGGVDWGESKPQRSIERFDSENDEWKLHGELIVDRSYSSGVVVSM